MTSPWLRNNEDVAFAEYIVEWMKDDGEWWDRGYQSITEASGWAYLMLQAAGGDTTKVKMHVRKVSYTYTPWTQMELDSVARRV